MYVFLRGDTCYFIESLGETSFDKILASATSACHVSQFDLAGYHVALSMTEGQLYQKYEF